MFVTIATKSHLPPSSSAKDEIHKDFNALKEILSGDNVNEAISKLQATLGKRISQLTPQEKDCSKAVAISYEISLLRLAIEDLKMDTKRKTEIQENLRELKDITEVLMTPTPDSHAPSTLLSTMNATYGVLKGLLGTFASSTSNNEDADLKLTMLRSEVDAVTNQVQENYDKPEKLKTFSSVISGLKLRANAHSDILSKLDVLETFCNQTSKKKPDILLEADPLANQWRLAPVGLGNLACNCWANSILQLVTNTPTFWEGLQLIRQQLSGSSKPEDAEKLRQLEKLYQSIRNYFAAQQNQQPGSALIAQDLRNWTQGVSKKASIQEDAEIGNSQIISETQTDFELEQTLTITNWNPSMKKQPVKKTIQKESMMHIPLHLSSGERHLGKLMKACYADISHTVRITKKNKNLYKQAKQSRIKSAPHELFVHTVRFKYEGRSLKIKDDLVVPKEYFMESKEVVDGKPARYELKGCIIHIGDSIDHGHYVSVVKKPDGWYLCNDEDVIPFNKVEAYLKYKVYEEKNESLKIFLKGNNFLDNFLKQGYIFQYSKTN